MKRKIIIRHWSMKHPNQYIGRPKAFKHTKLLISFSIMVSLAVVQGVDYKVTHPVFVSPLQQVSADYTTHSVKEITPSSIPANPVEREANSETIKKIWGADWQTGVNIATCESGMRTNARNENTNGTEDQGVFQVNTVHGMPDMFNAVSNISYAYTLFLKQGLSPWESSRHCWENK